MGQELDRVTKNVNIADFGGKPKIAYFSMEIGIDEYLPTYSGGLGVLAGDTLKSCADLNIPVIGITLLSEHGYFYQKIDHQGNQTELPVNFSVPDFLTSLPSKTKVTIDDRDIELHAWLYQFEGVNDYTIPIIFLDSNVEGNDKWDRSLTQYLYGGDEPYRLAQEIILGIGGVRMLRALGYDSIDRYHMNEGHAALGTLELYRQYKDINKVRKQCVFTTHTPVPAGHDQFDLCFAKPMVGNLLKDDFLDEVTIDGKLNMTHLALHFSHYVNGVAKKHGEVSRSMFPGHAIDSITNGVHSPTWVSDAFRKLFDKHIPCWRSDPFALRSAFNIDKDEIWNAHFEAKKHLIDFVNERYNASMDYENFTIGFARRQTSYKRADLLISDYNRLKQIAEAHGTIQIIYSGKAHPKDQSGKETIRRIYEFMRRNDDHLKITFINNYNMIIGKMMTSGADIWLNTPKRPLEASGTSGMKAAHNGVPQFGTLDGWWLEGCIENITGWSIGPVTSGQDESDDEVDKDDLYRKLEQDILPKYYTDQENWRRTMRSCIAINGSFFNTNRMVQQYVLNAYFM